MEVRKGDRVSVNLAPFIGSVMRSDESISCEVLKVDGLQVLVRAEPPYRDASIWVLADWIDNQPQEKKDLISSA